MNRYKVTFYGRKTGALGVGSLFSIIVLANDDETAKIATYEAGYEHISFVVIDCLEIGVNHELP